MFFSGKRLLIMGGTLISCEIVRQAQSMGIYTVVADYYPPERSPAKRIADKAVDVSVTDVDAVVNVIKQLDIDGVLVGFNDMLLPYYADICVKANKPCYGTRQQFELLIAKDKYKSLCRQFGVPTIPEYEIDDPNIVYPVLVKPVDNSGSRGISICGNREEMMEAINTSCKASQVGKVIIERYITGREVTVFWTIQDGSYYLSALANRHIKYYQGDKTLPLPVGYTFPSIYLPKYQRDVADNCRALFRHIGLKNGMVFMQCKVIDDTCYLYDLGYRLTGSLEYKLLERVCGYNPLEMMICFALTGKMGDSSLASKAVPRFAKPAFNVSCLCAQGTIVSYCGIDEIKKMPEVEDVVIAHEVGETISSSMIGQLSQVGVRILGTVNSKEDLYPIMNRINKILHIISDKGDEMLLPGIEEDDILKYVL